MLKWYILSFRNVSKCKQYVLEAPLSTREIKWKSVSYSEIQGLAQFIPLHAILLLQETIVQHHEFTSE